MKTIQYLGLASLLALGACDDSTSKPDDVSPTGDIGNGRLYRGATLDNAVNHEREAVSASWALQTFEAKDLPAIPQVDLAARPAPHVEVSRGYRLRVTAAELVAGVKLPLSAPGAFVHLSPQGLMDVELDQLVLVDGVSGQELRDGAGIGLTLDAATLDRAGIPAIAGAIGFKPKLDAGVHELKLTEAAAAGMTDDLIIQVEEPGSAFHATAAADNTGYLLGDTLTIAADWQGADVRTERHDAIAILPSGKQRPIVLTAAGATLTGSLVLDDEDVVPGALIDVEVQLEGVSADGVRVRRTVKTSVAYALPTAAFRGDVRKVGGTVDVGVDVGSPGRYAVTAVVYGTDDGGALVPFMMTQSARFLEPGSHVLTLKLDPAVITAAGVREPFEVRDLELMDQTRVGQLGRRAMGVRLAQ